MAQTTTPKTTTCTRCLGTGQYSFNLKDGTVCYGCGGKGTVAVTPKGRKVKATAENIRKARQGDTVYIKDVLYKVESIKWIEFVMIGNFHTNLSQRNQELRLIRMVDEKVCRYYLDKPGTDGCAIHPTPEMIGQDAYPTI